MELDLENPLGSFEDLKYYAVQALLANEPDHMPSLLIIKSSAVRFSVRRRAVSLISQAQLSYNLDPFTVYLAVNYIDRFLSRIEIMEKKAWIARILVVSSLSLAAKMRNCDLSISLSDFQREEGFEFEEKSIHRMEALLLATLQWRTRSITALSFLQYFICLLKIEDFSLSQALKNRASIIILNSPQEIKLLDFRPSLISASAVLCAAHELVPLEFSSFKTAIASCVYINNERLQECLGVTQEMVKRYESGFYAVSSGTLTPMSVLDQQCTSPEGEHATSDDVKRRRPNNYSGNRTVQISQIQQC